MNIKTVETYTATIYVGTQDQETKQISKTRNEVYSFVQDYVDKVGQCVTFTETSYIYTNGNEPGYIIGFINYPRFPAYNFKIYNQSIELAEMLRVFANR